MRYSQLYLIESVACIGNRNRIMTGVRLLFRVTLHRHNLVDREEPARRRSQAIFGARTV